MSTTVYIFLAVLSYSSFGILLSRASGKMDAYLIAALGNAIGVVVPLLSYLYVKKFVGAHTIKTSLGGLFFAFCAGLAISLFTIFLARAFEKSGGNISYIMPTIYGGTVALTFLIGWLFFREHINVMQGVGALAIVLGFCLIIYGKLAV